MKRWRLPGVDPRPEKVKAPKSCWAPGSVTEEIHSPLLMAGPMMFLPPVKPSHEKLGGVETVSRTSRSTPLILAALPPLILWV